MKLNPVQADPFNAETPLQALAQIPTPAPLFFVRSAFAVPQIQRADWRLLITGAVARPRELSFADLLEFPLLERLVLLECAGNGRTRMVPVPSGVAWDLGAVSCASFRGVSVAAVLGACGLNDDAVEIVFRGADSGEVAPGRAVPFERSLPIDTAIDGGAMLAFELNGAPLTPEHGFPVRLIVPGWYGVASVKWVEEMRVIKERFSGYFQTERYQYIDEDATRSTTPVREVRVRSLLAQPLDGATLPAGESIVRGLAWSGAAGIRCVEVSFDGGVSWSLASLSEQTDPFAPVAWSIGWQPTPGRYTLIARATDEAGNRQPLEPIHNQLGYGNNIAHAITVSVT